jgi:hypothetical protein
MNEFANMEYVQFRHLASPITQLTRPILFLDSPSGFISPLHLLDAPCVLDPDTAQKHTACMKATFGFPSPFSLSKRKCDSNNRKRLPHLKEKKK